MYARSKTGAGFTVVETLIFLAISGLMFVLAINAMSGKQRQTEFTTAIATLRSELNQDLSNVADGNYLALDNVGCSAASSSSNPHFVTPAPSPPDGTCTVIGEILDFNSTLGPSGQDSYTLLPAIGRTYFNNHAGNPDEVASNLSEANPEIDTTYVQTITMPFGLDIATLKSNGINYGAFGLFSFTSFAGGSSTSNNGLSLDSGSEHVEIFPIPGTSLTGTLNTIDGLSNCGGTITSRTVCLNGGTAAINPSNGITFCVNSGTTSSQSATFTVGGANSPDSVNYKINPPGACP